MKKKQKWSVLFLSVLLILALTALSGCGGGSEPPENEGAEIPAEVQAIMDSTTELAANYAMELNGEWADLYAACLESGEGREFSGYEDLKATLDQFRIESGAYYIYMLTDMDPSDDFFEITVDGSEEPDDWMVQYETEGQFIVAQGGQPKASLSAWDNGENDPVWSAFAPVYDSAGKVVGILGVDYPAPEILDFPEWNRDSDQWNGMAVEF